MYFYEYILLYFNKWYLFLWTFHLIFILRLGYVLCDRGIEIRLLAEARVFPSYLAFTPTPGPTQELINEY
jgi:hypothetical protein